MAGDQLFDLTLTEEQRITRESMRRFAQAEIRSIAKKADLEQALPPGFLKKAAELGLALLPIPEDFGGAGMARSPVSNVLNAEDLAHGDFAIALATLTPQAFVNTLIDQGSKAQQEKYLSQLASEDFVPATIALQEPRATFVPEQLQVKAVRQGNEYVLNGVKSMVILGASAKLVLVVADAGAEGPQAFIVEQGAAGAGWAKEEYMGLKPVEVSRLTLDNVKVPASARLGESEKVFSLQRLVDLSRLGTCALAVGTCQAVLDYVVPYVNERIAFGEPISHRQAVAFMVANIAIELDAMRMLVLRAASRAEQGLDFHKETYLARVLCAEKSMEIGTNGVQLLGGHGFTREHPVEQWYRNLRAVAVLEGAAAV
ncbi:MAG: acyl-CoA dehydrogenase family protein [Pseudomonadota bacterium]